MKYWQYVRYEVDNRVAWITLDRPKKMNTFTGSMRDDLKTAVDLACDDDEVNVIVITGAGDAFCAGGDIEDFISGKTQAAAKEKGISNGLPMHQIVKRLHEVEKPVIASLNGVAAGGGAGLATACDIRIGCENTRFGMVFSKRGIFPDWCSLYFLPQIVGYAKACELTFTGEVIESDEAFRIGLVNKMVAASELTSETKKMAEAIANNAPIPIALAKTGIRNSFNFGIDQFISYETQSILQTFETEDAQEGFRAFAVKQTPRFKGR